MTDTAPAKKTAAPKPKATTGEPSTIWDRLARPFLPDEVEKLPKVLRRDDQDKGRCAAGTKYTADGHVCGGWHSRAVHLDYVGHAGITMRLNEVVGPEGWSWEPMATDSDGLPIMTGEFWIRLTVAGVTKYGVGDDFNRSAKQAVGDALRNAAMRFGIATYLWSKSDAALALKQATDDAPAPPAQAQAQETAPTPPPSMQSVGSQLAGDLQKLLPAVRTQVQNEWPFPGRKAEDLNDAEVGQVRAFVQSILADAGAAPPAADPWATPGPGASGDQPPS